MGSKDQQFNFKQAQYQLAVESFRAQYIQMIGIMTFLIIADITVIGFALDKKIASMFFLGDIFLITVFFVYKAVKEMVKPVVLTGLVLERNLLDNYKNSLINNFFEFTQRKSVIEEFERMFKENEFENDPTKFKEIDFSLSGENRWSKTVKFALSLIFLIQLVLPFILIFKYNWEII